MDSPLTNRRARALFALVFAVALISGLFVAGPFAASAQTTLSQCNGTDNVGGQAVECSYTVTNTVNGSMTSSSVTLRECHGAANAPPTCTTSTVNSTALVTTIDQCNGSGNGGGGTVTCSVDVVNNITGLVTPTPATVNQCNSSGLEGGTEPTILCDPYPATTTGANVTQCNGSGNGGGGTMRVRCTVSSGSTTTSLLNVFVDQCNGSGNGGGATVTCRSSLTNNITAPAPGPTATPTTPVTPTTSASPAPTTAPTVNPSPLPTVVSTPTPPLPGPTDRPGQPNTPNPQPSEGPGLDENSAGGSGGGGTSVQGGGPTSGIDTTGQVTQIPTGSAATGGGSTAGLENINLLALGFIFLGAAVFSLQMRSVTRVKR